MTRIWMIHGKNEKSETKITHDDVVQPNVIMG